MSLSIIKAVTTSGANNGSKKQTYYLREFETKGYQDTTIAKDAADLAVKLSDAVVTLTWTKSKGDAKLIHHANGQDFVNRLPKSDSCIYSLVSAEG